MSISDLSVDSPIGRLRLVAVSGELVALELPISVSGAGLPRPRASIPGPDTPFAVDGARPDPVLAEAARQLDQYFEGRRTEFELPLRPDGTEFQRAVWRALLGIRFGETWSYGQLARAIGKPTASRAVGAANGRNPIPIVIPCHRVIGADGSLTGYGGGEPAKRWLLDHEARLSGGARGQLDLFGRPIGSTGETR